MFSSEQEALRALKGQDRVSAANAEAFLWRHWCQSGDLEADRVFRNGVDAMQRGELELAETLFGKVLEMAPQFAEGWNKRATIRYLRQNFAASIGDCQETLTRNPNHFGASAGQGLCHMALDEYREAVICFRRALEIHPHLHAVQQNLTLAQSQASIGEDYLH
ncbi:MAG TPA: tetratricopeptide repeat protein [Candidatus Binatia bacterium]|nr:tetratricopeptide repeat protein [Candidatus Binatia bacterium]